MSAFITVFNESVGILLQNNYYTAVTRINLEYDEYLSIQILFLLHLLLRYGDSQGVVLA